MPMHVRDYTSIQNIKFFSTRNKYSAIEELARTFEGGEACTDINLLVSSLKEREEIMSTGIGFGIAIPHAKIPQVKKLSFAVGISRQGIDFDSMDGVPVNLIILVLASDTQAKEYLSLLAEIMQLLKVDSYKDKIIAAKTAEEIFSLLESPA